MKISVLFEVGFDGVFDYVLGARIGDGAKNIIENSIKPNFKENRYIQGLDEATNRIIAYASGEYVNDEP
ncbi:MAG: hypothetical protein ACKPAD_15650, partial [Bacteroidota bacterium]